MVIFDAFKKNSVGVWLFCPDKPSLYGKKKPCYGFGQIKYLEGSVYTGRIFFDGKNYLKKGKGQQDFIASCLGQLNRITGENYISLLGISMMLIQLGSMGTGLNIMLIPRTNQLTFRLVTSPV